MGKREEALNTHLSVLLDMHDGTHAQSEISIYGKVDGKRKKIGTPDVCVGQLDSPPLHELDNTGDRRWQALSPTTCPAP